AGDGPAFEAIVRRLEWPLRTWLVARCPPGTDADDIAQSTFLEAFTHLGTFTPGTDFRAWLFTIARYQLMAECTRLRRLADYHSRYVPHALADELQRRLSQEETGAAQRLDYLRQCLEQVQMPLRDLLRWRYEQGLPLSAIAARLNRTVAAIKKQLYL